ncbi:hypothetical protein M5585_19030 [Serratia ureilytica]
MSEMMNESGAPAIEWSYGGRGDDISSSLSLDTVEEQPQGFLMTVDRPVQIFKDALSPMMAFVTLLRPLYAKTSEGFQYVPVSNPGPTCSACRPAQAIWACRSTPGCSSTAPSRRTIKIATAR